MYRSSGASKHSATTIISVPSQKYVLPISIRSISYNDIKVSKEYVLGMGTFGKCVKARVSHLDVCAKVFRTGPKYEWSFPVETFLLSRCCHECLPWIYGIVYKPKIILTSLHTYNNRSVTLHSALHNSALPDLELDTWKKVLHDLLSAVHHLHEREILHNDIKTNNFLIEKSSSEVRGVLIDLGKGCLIKDGKRYCIADDNKRRDHIKRYSHIAPDLVNGHCTQSTSSDVYSVGKIITQVNNKLCIPALKSLGAQCNEYNCTKRPTVTDLKTFIFNLFDYKYS